MQFEITSIEDITRIKFVGVYDLDYSITAEVRQELVSITKNGGKYIIDLMEVEWMDSSAVQMLLRSYDKILKADGKMAILAPTKGVQEIFTIGGFYEFLPVFDSLELAIAELKK
jgi:stage II sporulation protein AA (anti-sigma F factor antagonist)